MVRHVPTQHHGFTLVEIMIVLEIGVSLTYVILFSPIKKLLH